MSKLLVSKECSVEVSGYLNEVELAELLGLSPRTLQNWRLKGEGPPFGKFGRSVRYSVATVAAWVAGRERSSTSASSPPNLWGIQGDTPKTDLRSQYEKGAPS